MNMDNKLSIQDTEKEFAGSLKKMQEFFEVEQGLRIQLDLQSKKIQTLLHKVEELGCNAIKNVEIIELKNQIILKNLELERLNSECQIYKKWYLMGIARLGNTFEIANNQLDTLYRYTRDMGSPSHRILSFILKKCNKILPLKKLSKVFVLLNAIKKA